MSFQDVYTSGELRAYAFNDPDRSIVTVPFPAGANRWRIAACFAASGLVSSKGGAAGVACTAEDIKGALIIKAVLHPYWSCAFKRGAPEA